MMETLVEDNKSKNQAEMTQNPHGPAQKAKSQYGGVIETLFEINEHPQK